MKFFVSLSIFLGAIVFCFMLGAGIGAYTTDFCLPNGCGYEAGGFIGFYFGFIPGALLALYMWKKF